MGNGISKGTVADPSILCVEDPNTGINLSGSDTIQVVAGGTTMINVATTGVSITGSRGGVVLLTANTTLTSAQSGSLIIAMAPDLDITLPAASTAGLRYTIGINTEGLSGGVGMRILVPAGSGIVGNGITAVTGKGLVLTGATDRKYDNVTLVSTGMEGDTETWYTWMITSIVGTWAAQA